MKNASDMIKNIPDGSEFVKTAKKKIYGFNNGGNPGFLHAIAICEDGHVLGQHLCSHEGFMRHDLGFGDSTWKHENYDKHCGADGWELVWVDYPSNSPELDAAIGLNKALAIEKSPA
jgi:hypothetical protein